MNQTKGAEAGNDPAQATAPAAIILRNDYPHNALQIVYHGSKHMEGFCIPDRLRPLIHPYGCISKIKYTYIWM